MWRTVPFWWRLAFARNQAPGSWGHSLVTDGGNVRSHTHAREGTHTLLTLLVVLFWLNEMVETLFWQPVGSTSFAVFGKSRTRLLHLFFKLSNVNMPYYHSCMLPTRFQLKRDLTASCQLPASESLLAHPFFFFLIANLSTFLLEASAPLPTFAFCLFQLQRQHSYALLNKKISVLYHIRYLNI